MPVSKNNRRKKQKKVAPKVQPHKPIIKNVLLDDEEEIAPGVFTFGDLPEFEALNRILSFSNKEAFDLLNSHVVYAEKENSYTRQDIAIVVGMLVLNDETEIIVKTPKDGLLQLRKSTFYQNFVFINMDI